MRLFEHPEFRQAIIRAAKHYQLRELIIEKDYYVTEALRIINTVAGEKVIFKGGTSLSKGWNLIQRFSEDIDIFLDPSDFSPSLGKNAINRELKKLRDAVVEHPGLRFVDQESKTIGGFGRSDFFEYVPHFTETGEIKSRVLIEVGTASGKEPTANVKLQSYLGKFLEETSVSLEAEDESAFEMRLLHFRRTFVEKLFAIHAKVELFKREGIGIGSYARHYYDLFCLSERPEVLQMLNSNEFMMIKTDYDKVSKKYFEKNYVAPPELSFVKSDALFPSKELEVVIARDFVNQCKILCFGAFPAWIEVKQRFQEIRGLL